jgi:type I restriction enzyme, S subunit
MIHPSIARAYRRSVVQGGDLLLSIVGYVGQSAVVPQKLAGANITQTTARIAIRKGLSSRYFLHQLRGLTFQREVRRYMKGSAQPGLNLSDVEQMQILVPPPLEQWRIAEILDAMDEVIRSTERLIAKLEQAKQGLLHDLLSRGIDESGHLRDPKLEPSAFVDSPVGPRPSSWSIASLGSHITLQRGFDITVAEQRAGAIPVVSSSGVSSFHDRAMVKGPGVVIGRKGKLGDSYYIPVDFWPHDTSLWVREFKGNIPRFIAILLKAMRLERFDAATSVPTLNRNFVHPVLVAVPPVAEQRRIIAVLDAYDGKANRDIEHLKELRFLKQGLMDDLLTGRVRVNVEEVSA